jgi:hypothetical protein
MVAMAVLQVFDPPRGAAEVLAHDLGGLGVVVALDRVHELPVFLGAHAAHLRAVCWARPSDMSSGPRNE